MPCDRLWTVAIKPLQTMIESLESFLLSAIIETPRWGAANMTMILSTEDTGLEFASLYHHDGRFIRRDGVFAFSRRGADGGHTVLHMERAADISRTANSGHSRWDWAIANGMNELLVSIKDVDSHTSAIPLSELRFVEHLEAAAEDVEIAT